MFGSANGLEQGETMTAAAGYKKSELLSAIEGEHISSRDWPLDRAYTFCERLARAHYENFPVGSLLIPRALRKHVYSIYAFARTADDFADEGQDYGYTEKQRVELLERWHDLLRLSDVTRATHPIFVSLKETRRRFDLPIELFEDLLSAFKQDVTTRRYASFEQLVDYCQRSANPVGRLILMLFGYRSDELFALSDYICTALQLANHWQDVRVDLAKDRVYLPQEDISRFGCSIKELERRPLPDGFKHLLAFEIARTRELFRRGKPLCTIVEGRLGLELRAVWLGGWKILDLIERADYDVFRSRPVITGKDKIGMLSLALRKEAFRRI